MKKENQSIHQIANFLVDNKQPILDEWKDLMEKKMEKATVLSKKSRKAFYNSIPLFLDQLNNAIKNDHDTIKEVGKLHGVNRWEYEYNLKELIEEWGVLQEVLMNKIYRFFNSKIESVAINKVQLIITKSIQKSISGSLISYNKRKEEEAAVQMKELKVALDKSKNQTTSIENLRGTSHDLKGALFSLKAGFSLLQERKFDNKSSEIINQMEVANENVEHLINDLLDLFRLEAGQEKINTKEFNISDNLQSFCESMEPAAKAENLELKYSGENNITVQSDEKKIQRIAQNLILNSLKYTKSGFVEIRWKENSESTWLLKIRDSGSGITETQTESLTTKTNGSSAKQKEVEASTKEAETHGEGIGLLIVKRLCRLLNAVIEIETEEGKGTNYEITFPLKAQP